MFINLISMFAISGTIYWLCWKSFEKKYTDWMWDRLMEVSDFIVKELRG